MSRHPVFGAELHRAVDELLQDADQALERLYPGDRGVRQPVHTVYVPADAWTPALSADWGSQALDAVEAHGGMEQLAQRVIQQAGGTVGIGLAGDVAGLAGVVTAKLRHEPIEDLRLDFEDGFGLRDDAEEDAWAVQSAHQVARALTDGVAPAWIGIRFRCLEADSRRRGLRTLDLFLTELHAAGGLPEGLVLTLPKVTSADQVRAMVLAAGALEEGLGLPPGRIGFEVQVETPQLILGADGTVPLAAAVHAGEGRVTSLHYGTYDYSASLGIAAAHQSMDHPVADFAKQQMLLAAAETGVHVSDGSTNILPVGEAESVFAAWDLHSRLVRRHLQRGIYQGWDLHPHQLPTRFLATFLFYREGFEAAARRIRDYVAGESGAVLDEPATAKALAGYLQRGLTCGAVTPDDVVAATGLDAVGLASLARTGRPA
ncbi:DUF6986 family protein [Nesterenkonia xinjiangensis]|uniref:HpcH/HpaI aldolase/citrate lyase family protein n=1 Tax=Nesterenkonia xinjiangensis TaxID=225327 RepID=A0A7Z0K8G4_9MICC|nr:aldolase/citrate lyase family protein [Nesterenkonia xinjiangensis]NYJ77646.1 hypothetical protein [Nesterenkonia xinjiangensis]